MNVLQVTPLVAYPPKGGGQHRVHGLMLGRSTTDTVTRFATAELEEKTNAIEIEPGYREQRFSSHRISAVGFLGSQIDAGNVFANIGLRLSRPESLTALADTADVIVVEFPWQMPYVNSICPSETPLVYSSHVFETEQYGFLSESFLTKPFYNRVKRMEQRAVRIADLVVTTSQRNSRLYQRNYGATGPFYVAPNAVQASSLDETIDGKSNRRNQKEYVALFIGSNEPHNVDAVEYILHIAQQPQVQERPVRFRILGNVCNSFSHITPPKNVEFLGYVDEINLEYREADIGLNPVTYGGGSNIKVLGYFAKGLAVITTEYGLHGNPAQPGHHCIVASDSFTDTLVEVLDDGQAEIDRLGNEARSLVKEELTWEAVSTRLFNRLRASKNEMS